MVAGGGGDDASATFLFVQGGDEVDATTYLEGAGGLDSLALEVGFAAELVAEGVETQERGGLEIGGDDLAGAVHVGEGGRTKLWHL